MRACLMLTSFALAAYGCSSAYCDSGLVRAGASCVDPGAECDINCGTHEVCDPVAVPNACKCARGYAGTPCTWEGVVEDPDFLGFENELGEKFWVDEDGKGAAVEPTAPGAVEPDVGVGALAPIVICTAGGLSQVIQMPNYDTAEPLVAEIVYRADGVHGVAVGFDRAWKRLPPTGGQWSPAVFCLGDAAYSESALGGPVTLRISASERLDDCLDQPAGNIRVDSFDIRPLLESETCPSPGEALNPTASSAGGEWSFVEEGAATSRFEPGKGNESSGATLRLAAGATGRASTTVRISVPVPSTLPSPALAFWWKGASGKLFAVDIGTFGGLGDRGRPVETLVGTNAGLPRLYCLPPWTHGSVLDLTFSLVDDGTMEATELAIDDIAIRTADACGNSEDLLDPGFESAPIRWMGSQLGSSNEQVIMQDDSMRRTGDGALELTYWTSGADLSMESYVLVPQAVGDDGPAAIFHSKVPPTPSADVRWLLGRGEAVQSDLEATGDWEENLVCLPPAWSDRWFRLKVQVGPPSEAGMPIVQERIFLDDFELTTSADCTAR